MVTPEIGLHGVLLNIHDCGVLLTGKSGIGKSELALSLLDRGHQLIADDAPEFKRVENKLYGTCPALLQNLLAVRDIGVVDVTLLYDRRMITQTQQLELIIHLTNDLPTNRLLTSPYSTETILGVSIAKIILPISGGRNLPVLVEAIVKNYQLYQKGHNAGELFNQRQEAQIGHTLS